MFRRTVIIGVGLLGSSVGMNLISKKLSKEVVGVGRDAKNLAVARRRRAIHRFVAAGTSADALISRLGEDDLVILAAPVEPIKAYLRKIPKTVLVTDVGSVKEAIVLEADRRKLRFVGAHPIAGTERSGAEAGIASLFRGRHCVVTPSRASKPADVDKIRRLWKRLGCRISLMTAADHDRLFAYTSHLPHAVAYSLSQISFKPEEQKFLFSSFRDTTRVAASSPGMWRDIFLQNPRILEAISDFQERLEALKKAISRKDRVRLTAFLEKGQTNRQKL